MYNRRFGEEDETVVKNQNISIKEIAELAGVSIATVSRVINRNGRFSKETEERVKAVMEKYQYVPNLLARGLRTKQVPVVGIIIPDITNEFFSKVALEIQTGLFHQGYAAMICNTNEDEKLEEQAMEMLKSQQISGLVHISGRFHTGVYTTAIPTVYIDRKPNTIKQIPNAVLIESDNELGGYLAVKEMIEKGCRKIALITTNSDASTHITRREGYERALEEYGLEKRASLRTQVDSVSLGSGYGAGYGAVKQLLDREPGIDGIFCTVDSLAVGALRYLDEKKIKVPKQVKLVGFDDVSISETTRLPITTVRQSIGEMGRIAVEVLTAMMQGKRPIANRFVLPISIIRRKTT